MINTTQLPDGPKDGNRQWVITDGPTSEPITVTELKEFGRIDGSDEDDFLESVITTVREATENYLGRSLIRQRIKLMLDYWPNIIVELPRPPLLSVEEIVTLDEDSTETVYDDDNYFVVTDAIPGQIVIRNGASPPTNTVRYNSGIVVNFYAGYGPAASDVPSAIKNAMKLWCMQIYEMREFKPEPPPDAKVMLSMFRVWNY